MALLTFAPVLHLQQIVDAIRADLSAAPTPATSTPPPTQPATDDSVTTASTAEHNVNLRIVGQEPPNTLLIAWSTGDLPELTRTFIEVYNIETQARTPLYVHAGLLTVASATTNSLRTLLSFTTNTTFPAGDDNTSSHTVFETYVVTTNINKPKARKRRNALIRLC
jgi:hypothetical protein